MEALVNASSANAELVVVNGRLNGVRRPLVGPMTLLGRAPACEIRLNVEGIQPLHAALVYGPTGFFLRDLAGEGGVSVNEQPATLAQVLPGDVVGVGSFRFRLDLAHPSPQRAAEIERDAVRIQVAAVAAQQSALNEQESRLEQRRVILEKQEEQLTSHLEERRRRLLHLQEQTRQERETFQGMRAAALAEQAALAKELQAAREDVSAVSKRASSERRRLIELRRRMLVRAKSHWQGRELALVRREKELTAREARLQRAAEKIARDHAGLVEARLRLNGEQELTKRQLRERWQELGLAQQQWETCLNHEQAEREKRGRDLDFRRMAVEEAERSWRNRERSARLMLADLHRESAGLEARIGNLRENLANAEAAGQVYHALSEAPESPANSPIVEQPVVNTADRTVILQRMVGRLTDQRAHLLEQWQTLLRIQEEWRGERGRAMVELETVSRSLQEQEHRLLERERELDAAAVEWRQRQQKSAQTRLSLEARQMHLAAREASWTAERAALLCDIKAREEAANLQLRRFHHLARRREAQRRKEAEELTAGQGRCEDLRRQYVALWKECQLRRKELAGEQRDMAARALALEQMRQEVFGAAPNAAGAERRLERLTRRTSARIKASERAVETARKDLEAESERLEALAERLQGQQKELTARREELIRQQAAWEEREVAIEAAKERGRLELQHLAHCREQDQRQIAQLREEMERVAGLLIEETDATATKQAA